METSRSIKWCPGPGCQRAVRLPDVEVGRILFVSFVRNFLLDFLPDVEVGRMSNSIGTIVEKKEP